MHYFCTAGRGTEIFVSKELQKTLKLTAKEIEITDGKVFFQCSVDNISKLYELKTVERVFAQIIHVHKTDVKENLNKYNGIKKTIVDGVDWYNRELLSVIESLKKDNCKSVAKDPDLEPPRKKHCSDGHQETRFRISCRCTGKLGRQIQSQNLSRQIGVALSKCLNWTIDLKSPDIEVNIHLNDEGLIVGIPLKRTPLSKRNYIKHFGLRATVAWIIADIINPKNGDLVLDPMCGKGTILLELAKNNMNIHCVGIDKDRQQLKYAEENIQFADLCNHIEIIHADSIGALIKDGNVDKVVCDAPFGKKFQVEQETKLFYTQLFKHVDRVLRPGGQFVLLTSSEMFECIWRYRHFDEQLLKQTTSKMDICTQHGGFESEECESEVKCGESEECESEVKCGESEECESEVKCGESEECESEVKCGESEECESEVKCGESEECESEVKCGEREECESEVKCGESEECESEVKCGESEECKSEVKCGESEECESEVKYVHSDQSENCEFEVIKVNSGHSHKCESVMENGHSGQKLIESDAIRHKLHVQNADTVNNEEKIICTEGIEKSDKFVEHCSYNYDSSTQRKSNDNIQIIENKLKLESLPKREFQSVINCCGLVLFKYHYIKLGETDSYICVFNK